MDRKESISPSKSLSPPSYGVVDEPLADEDEQAMDSITVESIPLSLLPRLDDLSPTPQGQDDTSMRAPTDDSISDDDANPGNNDGDDEDEEESETLDANAMAPDYIVPLKDAAEGNNHGRTREISENSLSVSSAIAKTEEFEGSMTRNGKIRRLAPPPPLKRRKTPTGRSRTPRVPSPVIPPRSTSPWPEIQESDIRHNEDRDIKRRRMSTTTRQDVNGTKESTPQPAGTSRTSPRRQEKEDGTALSAEDRLKRSKRIKISPRKEKQQSNHQRSPLHPLISAPAREEPVSGTATPRFIMNMKAQEKEDSDPTRYNEEICGACGGPGRFLCCEGCPKSFHFSCLDPPIDENDLPEDSWYCKSCSTIRDPPHPSDNRLFQKLIDRMNRMNPIAFGLPKDIRNYFEGVTTGEDGEYQETHEIKPLRANARGFIEEPDPFRLRDKNGNPVFCFRCGDTASQARRILSCDHCSQHWHMDCLDPPLTALPPLTKKWMCPLHASHAYRRMRRPKHKIRVVEVSLARGFKTWGGDIEVENDESTDEELEGHRLLEDGFETDFSIDGTTYRLPEKGIKLDFLEKIHMHGSQITMLMIGKDFDQGRWIY